jgi:hypothetical protein
MGRRWGAASRPDGCGERGGARRGRSCCGVRIASVLTDGDKVEPEIDRAEDLADKAFRKARSSDDAIAALEARIVGTAITLAGCTLQDGEDGQEAVRVRAARYLARLSAGLLVMNQALRAKPGAGKPDLPSGLGEAEPAHSDRHATS